MTLLAVNVTTGIVGINSRLHDPAAYIVGARICGGAILLLACVATGVVFGLAASAGRTMTAKVTRAG